ncbi:MULTISPECIES: outer membrane lipid asymmetry maintenance protein MlaD [Halocynthiibacter]|uniref:Outer membrane lipid asymmetry maintenance protein MlaD n=1 Tax=Halocynthiibacter halioticoli TaxID=2986804 RepID=A0AAE3LQW3_9RHOB|nr:MULTISPECIES: outer membrane lipid asymmetry maintenance protein MlaD [Halocynthiibacter]MCV6823919.1 outer membrane lipid asymmetry maintenance protein MlaD [Halocynthiibacter halioticoli]MCW4056920.1 outer membrane lipid asymmetry maintenance protein MlaD [Halocynthiibacter sp. SDUM655004]MDE0590062.1 outer membrane lipid asymmetry maintenance protein MlaD [Halocynthiibacter sp. C4]
MSDSPTEVVVGGVVLAVALGFLAYASQATGFGARSSGYPLTASFRSAEGVSVGTDVRLGGVKIGTVTGMELNPTTFRADTEISILNGLELPDDSAITIASEGLLGGSFVEIVPGGSPFNYEPGSEIEDTQSAVSLVSLLLKFVSGSSEQ